MCKYFLGVHRKSTNNAVRGELSRFPLLIKILNHGFRYFQRIETMSVYSSVKLSCIDNDVCSLSSSGYSIKKRLLNIFNQSHSFFSDMQNVYRNTWSELIRSFTGKLRIYLQFKKDFTLENYVIQFPLHVKRNLTKLRISAHNFAVETGRKIIKNYKC